MSQDLVLKNLERSLRTTSLSDLVRVRAGQDVWLLVDASGSMAGVMRNHKRRIDGLDEVVRDIRSKRPVQMIAFGHDGAFKTESVPRPGGGTPLTEAIVLAKQLNTGRCIVISDGEPNNPQTALAAAKDYAGQIDVVFVGDPGEPGEEFLKALAQSTGGTEFRGDLSQPKELSKGIIGLITAGTEEEEE